MTTDNEKELSQKLVDIYIDALSDTMEGNDEKLDTAIEYSLVIAAILNGCAEVMDHVQEAYDESTPDTVQENVRKAMSERINDIIEVLKAGHVLKKHVELGDLDLQSEDTAVS